MLFSSNAQTPFFNYSLLRTGSDGIYKDFSGSDRVKAYEDRLEIASTKIPYSQLLEMRADGKVLYVSYLTADSRHVEKYFRHDAYWPGTAQKALMALVEKVGQLKSKIPMPVISNDSPGVQAVPVAPIRYAGLLDGKKNRHRVAVYSTRVSFPAMCPHCGQLPSTIATLTLKNGTQVGWWYIPVCSAHQKVHKDVKVENWNRLGTQLNFSFTNPEYAAEFYHLNSQPLDERSNKLVSAAPLFETLQQNTHFVVYQVAASALLFSAITSSNAQRLKPGANHALRSWPFTLLTLLLGWWGFPFGPIFTIRVLIINLTGGIDVTSKVMQVLSGQPDSPYS